MEPERFDSSSEPTKLAQNPVSGRFMQSAGLNDVVVDEAEFAARYLGEALFLRP